MTPQRELQRHQGTLLFARKLLTWAMVLQLPLVIAIALKQADLLLGVDVFSRWQLPGKVIWLLCGFSSILAIAGFTIVCRQLSLWEGNLEDSELARRTKLLGSMKIAAGIQFFFYLIFLAPLFNLIPAVWARSKASAAIQDLDLMMSARPRKA